MVDHHPIANFPIVTITCSIQNLMSLERLKFPKNLKYEAIYNQEIKIDITHNNTYNREHTGIKCVNLVKEYMRDCWVIEPIIFVIKHILKVT